MGCQREDKQDEVGRRIDSLELRKELVSSITKKGNRGLTNGLNKTKNHASKANTPIVPRRANQKRV